MDFLTSFRVLSSDSRPKTKMDVIASNLANVSTTSTPEGGLISVKQLFFYRKTQEKNSASGQTQGCGKECGSERGCRGKRGL
jgi:flagellar basal-body rod protein FlgC